MLRVWNVNDFTVTSNSFSCRKCGRGDKLKRDQKWKKGLLEMDWSCFEHFINLFLPSVYSVFFLCFIGFDVDINIINTYHFFIVVTELGDR